MAEARKQAWTPAEIVMGVLITAGTAFLGGFAWHYGMRAAEWYDQKEDEDGESLDQATA